MTGTLWHKYLEEKLQRSGLPIMTEVKLDKYLPKKWGGTADWVFWSDEYKAFVLGDLKTIKSAGLPWILKDGAKEAHMWQLSAYWYALRNMGLPLVKGYGVLYLPKDDMPGKDLRPTVVECDPLDEYVLQATMETRTELVGEYLERNDTRLGQYNLDLAPVELRELKRIWNKTTKVFDVVLKPHWSAGYCRFVDCGCSTQGQTKLGHFAIHDFGKAGTDSGGETHGVIWVPRKGVDPIDMGCADPVGLRPTLKDFK